MSRWMMPFLVGVLHGLADQEEQLQPLARREPHLVAVVGDRDAPDQLHDEVGTAFNRGQGSWIGDQDGILRSFPDP